MEFRLRVEMLERSIVCSYTNVWSMQIVKKLKHSMCSSCIEQESGRIRLISITTQTCILKSIMVFFEVAYCVLLSGECLSILECKWVPLGV